MNSFNFHPMKVQVLLLCLISFLACGQPEPVPAPGHLDAPPEITLMTGAERLDLYLPILKDKRVGIIANATSLVEGTHLVDTLLTRGINVVKVFAPEHGFRGNKSDGATIVDEVDSKTGVPLLSVYGKTKKPTPQMLEGLDILVFDIQDVGVRCYTFISTMHLCMEAAAENKLPFVVLDRPNPNGFYFDGPLMQPRHMSFVGMHPIPLVHGLTVGELAHMIDQEGWLNTESYLDLTVVPCMGYTHGDRCELPVAPSPNLPNMDAVYLYPSLVLLEATVTSVGRGTDKPFQRVGFPGNAEGLVEWRPVSLPGVSLHPKAEGEVCSGWNATAADVNYTFTEQQLDLRWILRTHQAHGDSEAFFNRAKFFDRLAGTGALRRSIQAGFDETSIRATWESDLASYAKLRSKYLLYPDFK